MVCAPVCKVSGLSMLPTVKRITKRIKHLKRIEQKLWGSTEGVTNPKRKFESVHTSKDDKVVEV